MKKITLTSSRYKPFYAIQVQKDAFNFRICLGAITWSYYYVSLSGMKHILGGSYVDKDINDNMSILGTAMFKNNTVETDIDVEDWKGISSKSRLAYIFRKNGCTNTESKYVIIT